jgi:GT2 family glycosyltransferase
LATQPTVTILVTVNDSHLPWLDECVHSVLTQDYPYWELLLCCPSAISATLHERCRTYCSQTPRIQIVQLETPTDRATILNLALERAKGELIGLLGQHDTLAPFALTFLVRELQKEAVDVLYSDEDIIDARGTRSQPFFKPDWSPDLCWSSTYACRFGAYRRQLVEMVGGFRAAFAPSLEYDLLLRCAEHSQRIIHMPYILYHKRVDSSSSALTASLHLSARRALAEVFERRGEEIAIDDGPAPETFHVRRRLRGTPLVSILIPTRDRLDLLRRCIESIEQRTSYRHYEILVIDNGSEETKARAYLAALAHRVVRDDGAFNFSRLNNVAVAEARGEYIVLLNNDTAVISPGWLEAMLEHAQRKEVGAVGALLLFPDDTIQHAGVVLGVRGGAGSAHKFLPVTQPGYGCFPWLVRNYSAVSAAGLMTRKAVYEEVGGLNETLAVDLNDIDWCLRLQERGYLIVYTPHARLYHYESRSRGYRLPRAEEKKYMLDRWGAWIARDPYYNPNLTLDREDFGFDIERARVVAKEEYDRG